MTNKVNSGKQCFGYKRNMWMTKYRSNYINALSHRHWCEIHINSNGFKRHDRFTNNVNKQDQVRQGLIA